MSVLVRTLRGPEGALSHDGLLFALLIEPQDRPDPLQTVHMMQEKYGSLN